MKNNKKQIPKRRQFTEKELQAKIDELFPKDVKPRIIEINPCEEALFVLSSIDAEKSILKKFQKKNKITKEDLEYIQKIVKEKEIDLMFNQRKALAKIKSTLD